MIEVYKDNILNKLEENKKIDNYLLHIDYDSCSKQVEVKIGKTQKIKMDKTIIKKFLKQIKENNEKMIDRYLALSYDSESYFKNLNNKDKKMKIIGIAGKAESGKTTFANILKEELQKQNKRVLLINYGDFLKFIARQYYNWNGEKDENGRHILQYIGTEKGRDTVNENIWVDMVINTVKIASADYDVAIIADCRFPNEFDRWREHGYDMLKIKMSRISHESNLTEEQRNHPSEIALDNYNEDVTIIQNEGSLDDLRTIAQQIIKVNL